MNRDKREPEYPSELESQFILRLPEEPAKVLREALRTSENLKSRLNIQIDNDMRKGEVKFDHWLMHAKIVDLPTIIESLKTIDSKSFYKTADICQMMVCKEEPDQTPAEEELPVKNKKKDPYKVDKKFLWPHGITPPTKNVRKRRFRKTLKKKYVEAPEIEKEVKRLLRADNEAMKVTWEIINEEDEPQFKQDAKTPSRKDKKSKVAGKRGSAHSKTKPVKSNVVDIFGGAVSDSDNEEPNINVEVEDSRLSSYDSRLPHSSSMLSTGESSSRRDEYPIKFQPQMFGESSRKQAPTCTVTSATRTNLSSEEDEQSRDSSKDNMSLRIEQVRQQLEELKQRRQRTQAEIAGMENLALKQRFKDILHTLNQDIMYKEMEYQGLITLQNSEDI
ncbi:transcription initiation factor TFIID subunit 7-like [Aricia agestis]|uniref:transcription initiation factor TFIID subunit 7-like n=1 Tax=Aricia agestis TaxID=91739 RepID=UPI001C20BA35|nr:transcription initiation factor TFIID subunit 7-like [Aricia agestis]